MVRSFQPSKHPVTTPLQEHYITNGAALETLCRQLRSSRRLGLDTEFVGEDSFIPKLELIQVAAQDISAVIDFPAVQSNGSLAPFWELICDPQVEKIVHAGRQDLDLFALHAGEIPKPFFDTQIAAYILNAALRSQTIADIVAEHLDQILPPATELPPTARAGIEALSAMAVRASGDISTTKW